MSQTPTSEQTTSAPSPKPRRRSLWRILCKLLAGLALSICLLTGGLLTFLHTDSGTQAAHYIGVQVFEWFDIVGLKLEIDHLQGPLPFSLTAKGVRMHDMKGLWLDVGYVHVELHPMNFFTGLLRGELYLHASTVETHDAHMIRIPVFPDSPEEVVTSPEPSSAPELFTLFPGWLRIVADAVDVRRAHVEPDVSYYGVFGHVRGSARLDASRGDARLGIACSFPEDRDSLRTDISALVPSKVPLEWPFPAGTPAGSTVIDAQATAGGQTKAPPATFPNAAPNTVEGSLRLVWEESRFGLTFEATDDTFVRRYAPVASTARFRLAAHYSMPVVPPVPGQGLALDAHLEGHFSGPKLPNGGRNISAQLYSSYDGEKLLFGPLRLESPDPDSRLRLLLAGGLGQQGNGIVINGEAKNLGPLLALINPEEKAPIAGGMQLCAYTGTGQDWWQEFIAAGEEFSDATLACTRRGAAINETTTNTTANNITSATKHSGTATKKAARLSAAQDTATRSTAAPVNTAKDSEVTLLPAAEQPAQRLFIDLTSPTLTLPSGPIHKLALRAGGIGTGESWLTAVLPAAFNGTLRCDIGDLFHAGAATIDLKGQWNLQTHGKEAFILKPLQVQLPGLSLTGHAATAGYSPAGFPLVQGQIETAITNWHVLSKLAGMAGYPLQGNQAKAYIQLDAIKHAQQLQATAQVQDFSCPDANLNSLALNARIADLYTLLMPSLAGNAPSQKNPLELTLRLGSGAAGGISWREIALDAHSQRAITDFSLSMRGDIDAALRGALAHDAQEITLKECFLLHAPSALELRMQRPATLNFHKDLQIKDAHFTFAPQGSITLDALFSTDRLAMQARASQLQLGQLRPLLQIAALPDATINAEAKFTGSPHHPVGNISLQLDQIRAARQDGIVLTAELPSALRIDGTLRNKGNKHALDMKLQVDGWGTAAEDEFTATASLPLLFSPTPTLDTQGAIAADIRWRGNLDKVWRYLPMPGRKLTGRGQAEANLSGTLAAPQLKAALFLGKASFIDQLLGIKLQNIDLEARYATHGTSIIRLYATDSRQGTLAINGTLTSDPALSPFNPAGLSINGRGIITQLQPLHRDDLKLQLSGDIAVAGSLLAPTITGNVDLDEVIYTLLDFGAPSVTTLENVTQTNSFATWQRTHPAAPAAPDGGPSLRMHVQAPGKIFIRGKGLSSEWKTDLRITGAAVRPSVLGRVEPVRGTFDILGKEFNFTKGSINFTGAWPPLPILDLGLTYQAQNIVAEIIVRGSVSRPKLDLSSQPTMPRDEIMAQILFDKNANELNRYQLLQAANTARMLVSGKKDSLDLLGQTQDLFGFEVLRMGSSSSGNVKKHRPTDASVRGKKESNDDAAPTLEVGKYLFDNVYVGVEQETGQRADTAVRVDIDVLPNVSVTGRSSSTSSNIGVNWKTDY